MPGLNLSAMAPDARTIVRASVRLPMSARTIARSTFPADNSFAASVDDYTFLIFVHDPVP
jgi:hypothetical protein